MPVKVRVDIKEFARDVERVCDFFIAKVEKDGSDDLTVLENLKEVAADIQFGDALDSEVIEGLSAYMKGL